MISSTSRVELLICNKRSHTSLHAMEGVFTGRTESIAGHTLADCNDSLPLQFAPNWAVMQRSASFPSAAGSHTSNWFSTVSILFMPEISLRNAKYSSSLQKQNKHWSAENNFWDKSDKSLAKYFNLDKYLELVPFQLLVSIIGEICLLSCQLIL